MLLWSSSCIHLLLKLVSCYEHLSRMINNLDLKFLVIIFGTLLEITDRNLIVCGFCNAAFTHNFNEVFNIEEK